MKSEKERLKKLDEEQFYLIFFDGTFRPSNPKYIKITMFNDTFYIENEEKETKNYNDMYLIENVKRMIEYNLNNIEKMITSKGKPTKSSSRHEFIIKIDNKIYRVDRNTCNEEGFKLFEDFKCKLYEIFNIKKSNNLIDNINQWKQNKTAENLQKAFSQIKNYYFYSPTRKNEQLEEIAIIKNLKGERLLPAFSSVNELQKWMNVNTVKIKRFSFNQYANLLLSDNINAVAIVIDPFGVNLILDKKVINYILQLK